MIFKIVVSQPCFFYIELQFSKIFFKNEHTKIEGIPLAVFGDSIFLFVKRKVFFDSPIFSFIIAVLPNIPLGSFFFDLNRL